MNTVNKVFEKTAPSIDREILFHNELERTMQKSYKTDLKGTYSFGVASFSDKKERVLRIEYGLEHVSFLKSADINNSTKYNDFRIFNANETLGHYDFDSDVLQELYLALLYMAKGIWGDKFRFFGDFSLENVFRFSTSQFNDCNRNGQKTVGELTVHSSGFDIKGPDPQGVHYMYGQSERFNQVLLFKFRRTVLEKFLHTVDGYWSES